MEQTAKNWQLSQILMDFWSVELLWRWLLFFLLLVYLIPCWPLLSLTHLFLWLAGVHWHYKVCHREEEQLKFRISYWYRCLSSIFLEGFIRNSEFNFFVLVCSWNNMLVHLHYLIYNDSDFSHFHALLFFVFVASRHTLKSTKILATYPVVWAWPWLLYLM